MYVIYKKEKCPFCDDGIATLAHTNGEPAGSVTDRNCKGTGYTLTEVDLLEVLKRVRWFEQKTKTGTVYRMLVPPDGEIEPEGYAIRNYQIDDVE